VPEATSTRTVVGNRVDFSAALDSFQGPLDLLLYLIKENEVDIIEIPIASILEQYLRFLDGAPQWDLQLAGEFLVMATTLMEIKSRDLLPVLPQPADGEEIIEDPRSELVRQLLQYRRLKEQARALEELQDRWEQQRPRGLFGDVPEEGEQNAEVDRALAREALLHVDLFTLFAAYERILKAVMATSPRNIIYDGESLEEKVTRIERILKDRPFARFIELISDPGNRADIAATFVALLELVRRRAVRLIQSGDYGSIDVKAQSEGEVESISIEESAVSQAVSDAAVKAKAEQDAALAAAGGDSLPWVKRRTARPKFDGLLKPEDVEDIDAEENEIGRRIDAILAAADAISDRFEQSHEGRLRDGETEPEPPNQVPAEPEAEIAAAKIAAPAEAPPEDAAAPDAEPPEESAATAEATDEQKAEPLDAPDKDDSQESPPTEPSPAEPGASEN